MKTIVIIDAGGRGAALVWKYAQSPHVGKIIAIPGNDFMQMNSVKPVCVYPNLKTTSVEEIVDICKKEHVDFIDVAQDNAVAVGLVDRLQSEGFTVFGPKKDAGELEWSKVFSRKLMASLHIPQPEFFIFDTVESGIAFLDQQPDQAWFVKADGLCEGKGALPAKTNAEAKERIQELQKFGDAAKTYLLEKWIKSNNMVAEEFSAFAISDGNTFQMIGYAQDHKRVFDGDQGENTGGMGVSTPPLVIDDNIKKQTEDIFTKTFDALKKEGRGYKGILYLGGILIGDKVYVIEFNARWGDPEAEVLIPSIENDWYEVCLAVINQQLNSIKITTDGKSRVAVAGCAKGYPTDYSAIKGKIITGLEEAMKTAGVIIFGAGMKKVNEEYVVNGGRLFYCVGEGKDVLDARERAYAAIKKVSIEGNNLHYRTDIGWRDVERLHAR